MRDVRSEPEIVIDNNRFWALLRVGLSGNEKAERLLNHRRIVIFIGGCSFAIGCAILMLGSFYGMESKFYPFVVMAGLMGLGIGVLSKIDCRRNLKQIVELHNQTADPNQCVILYGDD